MSQFPEVDRMQAVALAWPRLFVQPPAGMQPLTIDDSTLVVLCQAPNVVEFIRQRQDELVAGLNHVLDGGVRISAIRPVSATATEMYLARELLALKVWLRDLDAGF
jgi:hypothetical protein